MKNFTLTVFFALFLGALAGTCSEAQTINAASCNTSDVQNAINSAPEGGTVNIPAGTCTWTTGVTISGKGITLTGAGSSRVVAISSNQLSIATGTQSLTVQGTNVSSPTPTITTGETLEIQELGTETNFMEGTVSSFDPTSGALTLNVTSTGGSCGSNSLSNCSRWILSTPATTTIVSADTSNTPLFNVSEDTSFHTNICCFTVTNSTGNANVFHLNYTSGGQAVLLHDCRISESSNNGPPPSGNGAMIMTNTNRGVIWNCSFDEYPYSVSSLSAIYMADAANVTGNSWTSPSNMGSLDSNGQGKLYVESNDFHAIGFAVAPDDNARVAVRYNMFNNSSAVGTHGADSSPYGSRYFEFYNNVGVFNGYSNGTTFNINGWLYIRGGTAVIYNNTLPALVSQDYGTKTDVGLTVMNLQRSAGPDPCWGAGTSNGADYHAPRQVGYGYVTGKGTANDPADGVNNSSTDSVTYVGDSEPIYIWGNSRTPMNVYIGDFGGTECSNPDSSSNYIVQNRDYFNDTTAKPGWSPYTYPHPLRNSSSGPAAGPAAPTGLTGTVAAQ